MHFLAFLLSIASWCKKVAAIVYEPRHPGWLDWINDAVIIHSTIKLSSGPGTLQALRELRLTYRK